MNALRTPHAVMAGCLLLACVSAATLGQLHKPTSWLSRRVDRATSLPAPPMNARRVR